MQGKQSKDRNAQQPAGGQLLTELKFLKAQIVKKDLRIKELEEQVKGVVELGKQVKDLQGRIAALEGVRPEAPAGLELMGVAATPVP